MISKACALSLSLSLALLVFAAVAEAKEPDADWRFVETRLKKSGLKKKFIAELKTMYEPKHFRRVVELNVLLFLRQSDDHGIQVSHAAVENVKAFIDDHQSSLQFAEKEHGVSGSVIASLLWLESRHGVNTGRFHVPSVYLHLIQATRPEVVTHLHKNAKNFTPKGRVSNKNLRDITARTKTKTAWAISELKALQQIHQRDGQILRQLRGSFAGAFGIPQFLPSSYLKWARTIRKKGSPDLYKPQDAIHSVAFYLRDNGWKKGRKKSFVPALLRYNNSHDYAHAILKLAEKVEGLRNPAAHGPTKRK